MFCLSFLRVFFFTSDLCEALSWALWGDAAAGSPCLAWDQCRVWDPSEPS